MADPADISAQRAYYDRRWTEFGDDYANLLQLGRAVAVLQGLQIVNQRAPAILDLGCGTGWLTGILGRFGPTTGADLSPVAIEKARRRHPDIRFISGDLFDLDLPSESFDVIVSCQVIDHMEHHDRFLDLVARLLKPAGHFIVITTNPWAIRHWDPAEFMRFCSSLQPIENWLTLRQLASLLKSRFRIRRLRTLLPGYGHEGVLRVLHSPKIWRGLRAAGLLDVYQKVLLRLGCGLLIYAVAQRRPVSNG